MSIKATWLMDEIKLTCRLNWFWHLLCNRCKFPRWCKRLIISPHPMCECYANAFPEIVLVVTCCCLTLAQRAERKSSRCVQTQVFLPWIRSRGWDGGRFLWVASWSGASCGGCFCHPGNHFWACGSGCYHNQIESEGSHYLARRGKASFLTNSWCLKYNQIILYYVFL